MKKIVLLSICLFISSLGYSQANKLAQKGYILSGRMGLGLSKFNVSGINTEEYPSIAIRLGGDISKTIIGERIQLESGIGLYFRTKSKSRQIGPNTYSGKEGPLLHRLEETATQNHMAVEIPVSVRYLFNRGRSVNAGVMLRQWQPKKRVDLLASQTKLVFIAGLKQTFSSKLTLGIDVSMGLQDIYYGEYVDVNGSKTYYIRNQSAMLSVGYAI